MKRILSILSCLIIAFGFVISVSAESNAVYHGKADGFIFTPGSEYSPTDMFTEFKDVMPGDSIYQKITVKNEAYKEVKVKIYMRSLGAHPDSENFLSKLRLSVEKSNENGQAYMFDAAASETAQLTDWVELGTLYSGGTVDLNVRLDVPTDLDNNFKKLVGYLDWEFMVEEFPIEESDPEPPKTGDNSNIWLWSCVLIISLVAVFVLIFWRKKNKK